MTFVQGVSKVINACNPISRLLMTGQECQHNYNSIGYGLIPYGNGEELKVPKMFAGTFSERG